ncbi:MAG: SPOR domain-containing protein [Bacteroidetes bacterium]|nr:SPOR domain-containing protein [Bacteroidota bacterium]
MIRWFKRFAVIGLLIGASSAFSQTQGVLGKRFFDNWSVGVGGGPNIFFGDLKVNQFWPVSADMNEWKFAGTFTLAKQLSHVFAIRGQFLYSEISGTKRQYKDGTRCNQYFDGNILEGNINATINFSNLLAKRYNPKRKFFIYGTIGLGTSSWNSTVKQLYTGTPLRVSDSLSGWTTAMMGMAGVGAYFNMGDKVNLGLEWTLHGVNSDWLDVTPGGFKYDAYSMLSINITYNFNKHNPGKEPDTNLNKIFVPVYIQQPVKEVKPDDIKPTPVVLPKKDTVVIDIIQEKVEIPAKQNSEELFSDQPETGIIFRVQIFAFRNDKYTALQVQEKYNLDQEIFKDFSDGWYRFTIGSFTSSDDAKDLKNQMRKRGFKGAFIAKYKNGVRVTANGKK